MLPAHAGLPASDPAAAAAPRSPRRRRPRGPPPARSGRRSRSRRCRGRAGATRRRLRRPGPAGGCPARCPSPKNRRVMPPVARPRRRGRPRVPGADAGRPRARGGRSATSGISSSSSSAARGLVGELHRGQRDLHDVELVGERLRPPGTASRSSAEQALLQRGPGQLEPPGPQVGDAWGPSPPRSAARSTRSIALSMRCSRGSARVIATPSRPARPTRPMRWTYASGAEGTL